MTKLLTVIFFFSLLSCGQIESSTDELAATKAATPNTDIKGEKGDKGDKGDRGEKGEKGDRGEQGEIGESGKDGVDGLNGTDGLSGTAGVNGTNGVNGEDARSLILLDSNNLELGEVYYLDAFNNTYWIVNELNERFQIEASAGTFPNAYLVYAGLNCTGEKRIVIPNGYFANVYVDGRDSTIVKATGNQLGTFVYQSRVAQTNSCANSTGSALTSFVSETITLDHAYPIGRVYIQN